MVKPIRIQHIRYHERNCASDFSQGFVAGWLSYRAKVARWWFIAGIVFGGLYAELMRWR